MSTSAVLAALWPDLKTFLVKIGRWLLDVILEEGRGGLAVYMRQRVGVFKRRRKRAKSKRRQKWLAGRILRWNKAAVWLESAAAKRLSKRVATQAQELAERELENVEPELENFARWNRRELRRARRRARRAARRAA